ncbi:hypothetical protein AB0I53_13620 [Saccharopolyspora sp. NPDC050389]|uniref:hypothetical protein n=1 Tax=Saccharopolyspora sp. NPDC050389 TaxID=3155516 RepID=UPI0033CC80D1
MNERAWERAGAASGLLAAVLLLVSLFLNPSAPTGEEPVLTFFYVAGHQGTVLLAALLATLAAVVFLWFVGHLRHLLQRAEGGAEAFSPVVFAAGVVLSMTTVVSMLPVTALASMSRDISTASGSAVFALSELHRLALGPLGLLVALFAGTTGAAMVRREVLGPWVGWFGFAVAAIGLIAGVTAFYVTGPFVTVAAMVTGIVFAVWIGDAAILMLYRPEVDRAEVPGTAFAH